MLDRPLNILALAVGGNVTQGILKALRHCTVPHRVIGADLTALQFGLYTVEKGVISPEARSPDFFDWLIRTCKTEKIDIILTGCEPVLRALAPVRDWIEEQCGALCFVNNAKLMEICDDKLATARWLQSMGLLFPATADAAQPQEVQCLVECHGFPLIAKPRIGGGAAGVFIINSEDDLAYACRKKNYLIQEYLGSDDEEYTAGVFCDRNGSVCGTIVMWRALLAGTTYRAVIGAYPEIREAAEQIAATLKAIGPCNIQLRMTTRGPICFEINARFSGTTPIRAHFGFNEAEAVLRHFALDEPAPSLPTVTQGVALRYWNELYLTDEAVHTLNQNGHILASDHHGREIESYGLSQQ